LRGVLEQENEVYNILQGPLPLHTPADFAGAFETARPHREARVIGVIQAGEGDLPRNHFTRTRRSLVDVGGEGALSDAFEGILGIEVIAALSVDLPDLFPEQRGLFIDVLERFDEHALATQADDKESDEADHNPGQYFLALFHSPAL